MLKKCSKFLSRFTFIAAETLIWFTLVVLVSAAFFMVVVAIRPVNLGFVQPYMEAALYDSHTGNYATMEDVYLYWPRLSGPLYFGLKNARILSKNNHIIVSADQIDIALSRRALIAGKIRPRDIILKNPMLRFIRTKDNKLTVGLGLIGDTPSMQQGDILTQILEYIARPGQEDIHDSPIGALRKLEIVGATLEVEDRILNTSWVLPDFNIQFTSTRSGLTSAMAVNLPSYQGRPAGMSAVMNYVWDTKDIAVLVDMANVDTKIFPEKVPEFEIFRDQNIILNAHAEASLRPDFLPKAVSFEARSSEGFLLHPDISAEPVPYNNLELSVLYDDQTKGLHLKRMGVTFRGVEVNGAGSLQWDGHRFLGPVKLWIDEIAQAQLAEVWPEFLRGDDAEEWLVYKMSNGIFKDVSMTTNLAIEKGLVQDVVLLPDSEETTPSLMDLEIVSAEARENTEQWGINAENILSSFAFENMNVDYRAPLWPATEAKGTGSFDLNQDILTVTIDQAKIGDLTVHEGKIVCDRLVEEGVGDANVAVKLSGPLRTGLEYLSEEPVDLDKDIDFKIADVQGSLDATVKLSMPTNNMTVESVKVNVDGTLRNVVLPDVVQDLNLTGGPFDLSVKDGEASVKGKGQLEDRDIDFTWMEYLNSEGKTYQGKITASLIADPNMRQRLGIDLTMFVEGSIPVSVVYTSYQGQKSVADIEADLTPALLFVDILHHEKPAGTEGKANLTAHFSKGELQCVENLTYQGAGLNVASTRLDFAKSGDETILAGGEISRFTLGDNDAHVNFAYGDNRSLTLKVNGPFLDVSYFFMKSEQKGAQFDRPLNVSLQVNQMRTAPNHVVKNAVALVDRSADRRYNRLELDGAAGQGKIVLRYVPGTPGGRDFHFESDDAGAALAAFQAYQNMIGGKIVIDASPVSGAPSGTLSGTAILTDFRIVKAPALTKLLSILSLPGLLEVMRNEGLFFTKLEAGFEWRYLKEGSSVVFKDGRTSGNTLGLTFEGAYDYTTYTMDVSGTLVPLSGVNAIIGGIPLIGDILTGGSGSLFAATYTMKGSSDNPEIFVNPLSVLTPGILRRILFE